MSPFRHLEGPISVLSDSSDEGNAENSELHNELVAHAEISCRKLTHENFGLYVGHFGVIGAQLLGGCGGTQKTSSSAIDRPTKQILSVVNGPEETFASGDSIQLKASYGGESQPANVQWAVAAGQARFLRRAFIPLLFG
jgi:hypothetical protein